MSSDVVVFKDVVKAYKISVGMGRFKLFLDRVKNGHLGKRLMKPMDFVALNGVSFRIKSGERVGILGHNGAGKSTILKMIGRVAWPTHGSVVVKGRTGGILELGAGFHSDLTARDNILLTASLYGRKKREAEELVPNIVSIAEIDKFLDVPLKKFSSGMRMKLAFALAMITKPDIVLLDEAFAVGDARFQEKSSKMMMSFLENRTLILVSHSLSQIQAVCDRILILDHGQLVFDGPIAEGLEQYKIISGKSATVPEKQVIQPHVKRGQALALQATIDDAHLSPADDGDVFLNLRGNVLECDRFVFFQVTVKKTLVGQILDVVDQKEFAVPSARGSPFSKSIRISFEGLYPGDFEISVRLWTDKREKDTAYEATSLLFVLEPKGSSRSSTGVVDMRMGISE